jgi:hypothetical protein
MTGRKKLCQMWPGAQRNRLRVCSVKDDDRKFSALLGVVLTAQRMPVRTAKLVGEQYDRKKETMSDVAGSATKQIEGVFCQGRRP